MLHHGAHRLSVEFMNAREYDDKLEMSGNTRFVPVDLHARPWLVHASLRLGFASHRSRRYDVRSSRAPKHPLPVSPSPELLMRYASCRSKATCILRIGT